MDVFTKETVGRFDATTRQRIACELAARGPVTASEYFVAIDRSVSRQQAITDLRAAGLAAQGRGRGARWVDASFAGRQDR